MFDGKETHPSKNSTAVLWIVLSAVGALLLGALVGCGPTVASTQGGQTSTVPAPAVTAPVTAPAETRGALDAAKVLAKALEDKDEEAYVSVWDKTPVVASLYEPFISGIVEGSPGFARLAEQQGRGNDIEAYIRELMPEEKFQEITAFGISDWADQTLDMSGAKATVDGDRVLVETKTASGVDTTLVMEEQSDGWKVIDVEGDFRTLFLKNMVKGFESVMPK